MVVRALAISVFAVSLGIGAMLSGACGGRTLEETGTVSGTGGAAASSSSMSSTATGVGGGLPFCGGNAGVACAATQYCVFDAPPGSCGANDTGGHCWPRPESCTQDCPGVCGCDGAFYCNECSAALEGEDVSPSTACFPDGGPKITYRAEYLATKTRRFVIFKIDWARSLCVRLIVDEQGTGSIGPSSPSGWSVGQGEISHHVSDCRVVDGLLRPPEGEHFIATGGAGFVQFESPGEPPKLVDVHATLSFPNGTPAWVPATDALDAERLPILH